MYIFELKADEPDENAEAEQAKKKDAISGYKLGEMIVHENMNITNLRVIEGRHIYSLYNRVSTRQKNSKTTNPKQMTRYPMLNSGNGVGYMDLATILEDIRVTPNQIPVTNAVGGLNDQIRFSDKCQTITFMQGVDSGLQILPLLHQNLLPLQKMRSRSEYILNAELDDKFVALGYDKKLDVWDLQTGKKWKSASDDADYFGTT